MDPTDAYGAGAATEDARRHPAVKALRGIIATQGRLQGGSLGNLLVQYGYHSGMRQFLQDNHDLFEHRLDNYVYARDSSSKPAYRPFGSASQGGLTILSYGASHAPPAPQVPANVVSHGTGIASQHPPPVRTYANPPPRTHAEPEETDNDRRAIYGVCLALSEGPMRMEKLGQHIPPIAIECVRRSREGKLLLFLRNRPKFFEISPSPPPHNETCALTPAGRAFLDAMRGQTLVRDIDHQVHGRFLGLAQGAASPSVPVAQPPTHPVPSASAPAPQTVVSHAQPLVERYPTYPAQVMLDAPQPQPHVGGGVLPAAQAAAAALAAAATPPPPPPPAAPGFSEEELKAMVQKELEHIIGESKQKEEKLTAQVRELEEKLRAAEEKEASRPKSDSAEAFVRALMAAVAAAPPAAALSSAPLVSSSSTVTSGARGDGSQATRELRATAAAFEPVQSSGQIDSRRGSLSSELRATAAAFEPAESVPTDSRRSSPSASGSQLRASAAPFFHADEEKRPPSLSAVNRLAADGTASLSSAPSAHSTKTRGDDVTPLPYRTRGGHDVVLGEDYRLGTFDAGTCTFALSPDGESRRDHAKEGVDGAGGWDAMDKWDGVDKLLPADVRDAIEARGRQLRAGVCEIRIDAGEPVSAVYGDALGTQHTFDSLRVDVSGVVAAAEADGGVWIDGRRCLMLRGSLLRLSVARDGGTGSPAALTLRMSRCGVALSGVLRDIFATAAPRPRVSKASSVLVVGPPASGKTTLLRDAVRLLADECGLARHVVVVDAERELGGVDSVRRALGCGRRIGVGVPLADGIVDATRNQGARVVVADDVCTDSDARALSLAVQRGVGVVAAAQAASVASVARSAAISDLLGGVHWEPLNKSCIRAPVRKGFPLFDAVVEVIDFTRVKIHWGVADSVDAVLGSPVKAVVETRWKDAVDGVWMCRFERADCSDSE